MDYNASNIDVATKKLEILKHGCNLAPQKVYTFLLFLKYGVHNGQKIVFKEYLKKRS